MNNFSKGFNVWKLREGVLNISGKLENTGFEGCWDMKWIIRRQMPDSPPLQQGASEPIRELTGKCIYL